MLDRRVYLFFCFIKPHLAYAVHMESDSEAVTRWNDSQKPLSETSKTLTYRKIENKNKHGLLRADHS